ncbi:MAG: hypothetical protein AAFX80_05255 [Cyanobacteria bacterium J06639_18]
MGYARTAIAVLARRDAQASYGDWRLRLLEIAWCHKFYMSCHKQHAV